ncbi:MAG: hypothetical protein H6R25_1814 [Proteobacteria bacterium]|nr:hypothetical protein [Pseudomonadota bacterium]
MTKSAYKSRLLTPKMRDAASAAAVLPALANNDRLLLCHLSQRAASVGQMESALWIGQLTL